MGGINERVSGIQRAAEQLSHKVLRPLHPARSFSILQYSNTLSLRAKERKTTGRALVSDGAPRTWFLKSNELLLGGRSRLMRAIIIILLLEIPLLFSPPVFAEPGGELIIFHAGSLAVPFNAMKKVFNEAHPDVRIQLEAAGSRTCARKITDLNRPCDVMASADYTVIEDLLIPDYADWNISFATNEMSIMYRPDSKYSGQINGDNWYKILPQKDVEYGHSDPNSDPCGYRSQLVWQLAEEYYQVPGLYQSLRNGCPRRNIRPKETDLIAMLEAGQIDYLFIYRSVCQQHRMPFIALPDQINLKSVSYEAFYKKAKIKISGKKPGEFIDKVGKPMVYGITIPKSAQNPGAAVQFVAFVIGPEGQEIMRRNGQPPISPPGVTGSVTRLPFQLKGLVATE